ncbi:MAG: glycosyltransferase [Candidatus Hydrogenedentota bacterium]
MDFSLVIPAYNEEHYLPRLLDTIDIARQRYRGGADAIEVIVGDNASTDRTAEIAAERGCRVVRVEKRCIGAARNGGAAVAQGDILCFSDADYRIHPETFNVIKDGIESGKYVAGATGVRLERMSVGIFAAYCLMVPMVWLMRMDTGVVFCRREDFESIGGYNEERLFAEDVQFLFDMRRLGKPRGQRLARLTKAKVLTSTRKWDVHGDWHYVWLVLCAPLYFTVLRKQIDAFAQRYWYNERREAPKQ